MRPVESFRRHDWVYLPDDWRDRLAAPLSPAERDALVRWIAKGRPLVVARRRPDDAPGLIRLGLALPDKTRIGVLLPADAIQLRRRAPFFLDVVESAAALWPEAMGALRDLIAKTAPNARVFGSFAWQFFAAEPERPFVTHKSDIDLLLTSDRAPVLAGWIGLLQDFERRFAEPRLDGEITLPGGDFVSWREYAARPKKVLVKGAETICLRPIEEIDLLLSARAA
jgi:phosphoribosyl-dephospho-CoA transferase